MLNISVKESKKGKRDNERIRTDALLRETFTNYIRLIGDADRKARIMLIVNTIFLTISVTLLTKAIHDIPYVWISAVILMLSNMLTLFFSIQSVRPEFKKFLDKDVENNIMHYKSCHQLSLEEYSAQLKDTLLNNDKKMEAVIKDLYHYGNLLATKYRLLNVAYHLFSWGILLAVLSYLFIILIIQ